MLLSWAYGGGLSSGGGLPSRGEEVGPLESAIDITTNSTNTVFDVYYNYLSVASLSFQGVRRSNVLSGMSFEDFELDLNLLCCDAYNNITKAYMQTSFNSNAGKNLSPQEVSSGISSNHVLRFLSLLREHQLTDAQRSGSSESPNRDQDSHSSFDMHVAISGALSGKHTIAYRRFYSDKQWSEIEINALIAFIEMLWCGSCGKGFFPSTPSVNVSASSNPFDSPAPKRSSQLPARMIEHAVIVTAAVIETLLNSNPSRDCA